MKVRSLSRFFMGMLAMCAIAACSNDELDVNGTNPDPDASKDAVYMNVTVQLPTGAGTRAVDGTEVGLEHENSVNSVLLVLAKSDNELIGCAEKSESLTKDSNGKITTIQSISKSTLAKLYEGKTELDASKDENEIHVFVFCNPTAALRDIFKNEIPAGEKWYDQICSISEDKNGVGDNTSIWGGTDHQGGFLMSSAEISSRRLPTKLADWDNFTKPTNPFKLSGNNKIDDSSDHDINNAVGSRNGAIPVERSVARFDFKDGSGSGNNTYKVVKDLTVTEDKYLVDIRLYKMALVNMSKNFYYLRRVSSDGLNTNSRLCEAESGNYVVDTDATEKKAGSIISNNKYADHFNFCLGHMTTVNTETGPEEKWVIDETARSQWYTSKIADVVKGKDDNDEWGKGDEDDKRKNYKIWRYVTENTIPTIDKQEEGISTGIMFKGKMIPSDDIDKAGSLYDALTNVKDETILYVYEKRIYVSWKEVRAAAIQAGTGSSLYRAAFGNNDNVGNILQVEKLKEGSEEVEQEAVYSSDEDSPDYLWNQWYNTENKPDANLKLFKAAATGSDFTLYQSSSDDEGGMGYYCYYFYKNRHNDNGNNGVMGQMEFAVVRNNVYKLAVTRIEELGHPRLTENDPDPIDPENPDENGDVYLSVSVEVLPWVVRVNNIEF